MNWHLFRQDDPNTWPQIDCPMVIHTGWINEHEPKLFQIARWDNKNKWFKVDSSAIVMTECCYAYIGYAPSGYKTTYPTKCMRERNDRCAYDDDGYCMLDRTYACEHKQDVAEYSLEEKRIWKEFK